LRARATRELGAAFDVKEFHDIILLERDALRCSSNVWRVASGQKTVAVARAALADYQRQQRADRHFWPRAMPCVCEWLDRAGKDAFITRPWHRFALVGRDDKTEEP